MHHRGDHLRKVPQTTTLRAFLKNSLGKRLLLATTLAFVLLATALMLGPSGVAEEPVCDETVAGGTIQTAVDEASEGDVVCVENTGSTYFEEIVIDTPGVTLLGLGEGNDRPLLEWGSGSTGISITADDVRVEGFRLNNWDDHGILVDESDNVQIVGNRFFGNDVGVQVEDSVGTLIEDNEFLRNNVAVGLQEASGFTVEENGVEGNQGSNKAFHISGTTGGTVHSNTIDAVRGQGQATVLIQEADGLEFTDNTLNTNWEGLQIVDSTDITLGGNDIVAQLNTHISREIPGVWVIGGSGIIMDDNSFLNSNLGVDVLLDGTSDAVLTENDLEFGVHLLGDLLGHYNHQMTDNTIGGAPLAYSQGETSPDFVEGAAQHIFVDATDLVVEDEVIGESAVPLLIAFSDGAKVSGSTISDSTMFHRDDAATFLLAHSDNAEITGNTFQGSQGDGLTVSESTGGLVQGNTAQNNERYGITLLDDFESDVEQNLATGNEEAGIAVLASEGSRLWDNDVEENDNVGILLLDSSDIEVDSNNVGGNEGSGLLAQGSTSGEFLANTVTNNEAGIVLEDHTGATVTQNTVTDNRGCSVSPALSPCHGIRIDGSSGIDILENHVENNHEAIVVQDSSDVLVGQNTLHDNGHTHFGMGVWVIDSPGTEVESNTITENTKFGVFVERSDNTQVKDNTASGQDVDLVLKESTNVRVEGNTFERGMFLDGDELAHYLHDVEDGTNTANGLLIVYLSGVDAPAMPVDPGQFFVVDATNLVVDGLEIDAAAVGIQVAYSDDAQIKENEVTNSTFRAIRGYTMTLPAGIVVYGSADVEVRDNTANDNDRDGIRLTASLRALVEENHARNNGIDGISLRDAPDSEVLNNALVENDSSNAGVGVRVSHESNNVLVQNNTFTDNFHGVRLWVSHDVEVVGNVFDDSWGAITASGPDNQGSSGLQVHENIINGSSTRAIELFEDSDGARITDNVLNDVGSTGIYIVRNDDIVIEDNVINSSEGPGIQINFFTTSSAPRSDDIVIKDNTILDTEEEGILIFSVLNNLQVTGNTVRGASEDGVRLSTSHSSWKNDLHMADNTFEDNAGFGVQVFRSEGLLTGNTFRENAEGGLELSQSNDLVVSWNTFEDHRAPGIKIDSQIETYLHNNVATGNQADLLLDGSTDTKFFDNTLQGGALIEGSSEAHFTSHNFTGTTVNGAPIEVFYDEQDPDLPSDAGQLIIFGAGDLSFNGADLGEDIGALVVIDSGDVTVTDATFGPGLGIIVKGAGDVEITDSTLAGSTMAGVHVEDAESATITGNTMTGAAHDGVWLQEVAVVVVEGNTIDHGRGTGIHVESTLTPVVHDNIIEGGGAYGVWVEDADEAVVTNNTVEGAATIGIRLLESENSRIANNTATHGGGDGAVVGDFFDAHGAHLSHNDFSDNDGTGLVVSRSNDLVIEDVTVDDNGAGIELIGSISGTVIRDAAIRNNDGHGVFGTGIGDLSITDSVITGNAGDGLNLVQVGSVAEWLIDGNTISDNENGVFMDADAFSAPRLRTVEVLDNTIGDNTGTGVIVEGRPDDADDVTINNNVIEGNAVGVDYTVDQFGTIPIIDARDNWWGATNGPAGGQQDPVTTTVADGDGDSIVSAQGNNVRFDAWDQDPPVVAPFFEVVIVSTNEPVDEGETVEVTVLVTNAGQEAGVQAIELRDPDGDVVDTHEDLALAEGEDDEITLEWETEVGDWGNRIVQAGSDDDSSSANVRVRPIDTVLLDSCTTLEVPGNFELVADLTSSSTCITIATDEVSFDGRGHTITGENLASGQQFGVLVNHAEDRLSDVSVSDVTVEGWTLGVQLRETDDSQVTDVETRDSGSGFRLLNSNDNLITALDTHNNDNRGVVLTGSHNNEFFELHVHDNEVSSTWSSRGAVWFTMSGDNEFTDMLVEGGNVGIRIGSGLRNTFTDLTVQNTERFGIEVSSNSNKFYDVTVTGSGQATGTWAGIFVQEANNNHFENIDSSDNTGTGVRFAGSTQGSPVAHGNSLVNLTAIGNDPSGVSLSVAHNSLLRNLHLENSSGIGLDFSSRAHNTDVENVTVIAPGASAIQFGPDSQDNSVRDVTVVDSGGPVLDFRASMSSDTKNSLVEDISVEGSSVLFVSSWEAEANSVEGMLVDGMDLSFTAQDVMVSLVDQQPGLPEAAYPLGMYLDIKSGPSSPLDGYEPRVDEIHFGYTEDQIAGLDEDSLALWHHDGDDWRDPDDVDYTTGVDTTDGFVFAEGIDDFSVFGVFSGAGEPPEILDLQVTGGKEVDSVVYVSSDLDVAVEVTSESALVEVNVTLDAGQFSFTFEESLEHDSGELWGTTLDFDPGDLPDDGPYTLSVSAKNEIGAVDVFEETVDLMLDRVEPSLSAIVDSVDVDEGDLRVNVTITSDKILREDSLEVEVDAPGGDSVDYDGPFRLDEKKWAVEFDVEGTNPGIFWTEVIGTSLAGVEGTAEVFTNIVPDFSFNSPALLVNEDSGVFVEAEGDGSGYFILAENQASPEPLGPEKIGFSFVTGVVEESLEFFEGNMTLGIPVASADLGGMDPQDVELYHLTDGAWEVLETVYHDEFEHEDEAIDGGAYWIATGLSGFSSYGGMMEDDEPPEVTLDSPDDGHVFDEGTGLVPVHFTYVDDLSGVDVSSIQVTVSEGGSVITDGVSSSITSSEAHVDVTVEDGRSYELELSVSDNAGNENVTMVTFEVDGTPPASSSGGGGGGPSTTPYHGFSGGWFSDTILPSSPSVEWSGPYPLAGMDLDVEQSASVQLQIRDPATFPDLPGGFSATFYGLHLSVESAGPVSGTADIRIPMDLAADWDHNALVVLHHDGTQWNERPTEVLADEADGLLVRFALPESFSPFVLAEAVESVDPEPDPEPQPTTEPEPSPVDEAEEEAEEDVPGPGLLVVLLLGLVVLAVRRAVHRR